MKLNENINAGTGDYLVPALMFSLDALCFISNLTAISCVSNASKTGFSAIPIETLVHRACNIQPCGRHRFSRNCLTVILTASVEAG